MTAARLAVLASLLTCLALFARVAFPIEPNAAGNLAVHVVVTSDPDIGKNWISSAPSSGFSISKANTVPANGEAHVAFIITGHKADATGRPDIVVDATIRKPDGTILTVMRDYATVRYNTGEGGFIMADPTLHIRFNHTDPSGEWVIEAVARDRLSGKSAAGKAEFLLGNG